MLFRGSTLVDAASRVHFLYSFECFTPGCHPIIASNKVMILKKSPFVK